MSKLKLEDLTVESFTPDARPSSDTLHGGSAGPTLYGCTCGCGTNFDCPSADPRCTEFCIVASGKTDWAACCG